MSIFISIAENQNGICSKWACSSFQNISRSVNNTTSWCVETHSNSLLSADQCIFMNKEFYFRFQRIHTWVDRYMSVVCPWTVQNIKQEYLIKTKSKQFIHRTEFFFVNELWIAWIVVDFFSFKFEAFQNETNERIRRYTGQPISKNRVIYISVTEIWFILRTQQSCFFFLRKFANEFSTAIRT